MTNTPPLRAAIIGTGFIAAVHRDALIRTGVEIVGVLGSSAERSRAVAASWRVDTGYGDLAELLADDRVDVVHITSPNALHFEQALGAIRAGKHVVCEKPLAPTAEQTRELARAAEAAGVVHAVNFNIRHYPLVVEARERVRDGSVGEPRLVTGGYLQDWLLEKEDWDWRVEPEHEGSLRAVADIGTHWFDTTSYIVGAPIVEVFADLRTFVPVRSRPVGGRVVVPGRHTDAAAEPVRTEEVAVVTEDAATILVRYANGASGVVTVSQVNPGRKNGISFEIAGAKAGLAWSGERPDELWIGHRHRANEVLLRDAELLSDRAGRTTRVPGGHAEGFENTFAALYRAVYTHIEEGGPAVRPADYATFADGHGEALILEAIERSVATRAWAAVAAD